MPKQMQRPENHLALEEHRRCEKKARHAAERNADGRRISLKLHQTFFNNAAHIARDPMWREIFRLYERKAWPYVSRGAEYRVEAASQELSGAKGYEERAAARKKVDEASRFRTLAGVLHRFFENLKRINARSGPAAFRRAIKAAIKEAERLEKSAYWQAREAIQNESFGRHLKEILLNLGPPPTQERVTTKEWEKIVVGKNGEDDPRKPYDVKALTEKYSLKGGPECVRLANMDQRNGPAG